MENKWQKGIGNGLGVLMVAFFLGLIGLFVYKIVTIPSRSWNWSGEVVERCLAAGYPDARAIGPGYCVKGDEVVALDRLEQ